VNCVFNITFVVGAQILFSIKMDLEVLVVLVNHLIPIIPHLDGNLGLVKKISKIFSVMVIFVLMTHINVCLLELEEEEYL